MPAMGDTSPAEMPTWFITFYSQYIRQRDELLALIDRQAAALPAFNDKQAASSEHEVSFFDDDHDAEEGGSPAVDPLILRKMSLDITLLEGGILFHSVFVGMTVSATTDGFIVLLIAILFHQSFEGLGLGSRIAAVPYPKGSYKPWLLVVAFGTTAPFGQGIGLLARQSFDIGSAFGLIMVGIFNAISSGLLIYAALVNLLQEDFLSEEARLMMSKKEKITAFCYVLLGGKLSSHSHLASIPMLIELHSRWHVRRRCLCLSQPSLVNCSSCLYRDKGSRRAANDIAGRTTKLRLCRRTIRPFFFFPGKEKATVACFRGVLPGCPQNPSL